MNFDLHDTIMFGGIVLLAFGAWKEFGIGMAGIVTGTAALIIGVIIILKGP